MCNLVFVIKDGVFILLGVHLGTWPSLGTSNGLLETMLYIDSILTRRLDILMIPMDNKYRIGYLAREMMLTAPNGEINIPSVTALP